MIAMMSLAYQIYNTEYKKRVGVLYNQYKIYI